MEYKVPTEQTLSAIAEVVLKVAALVGVSAAIASFGYNFALCAQHNYQVAFAVPVFLLALFVFGIALGLTDKTFGTFRDMDFSPGSIGAKFLKLALYFLAYFMEVSLFTVAFYSFRVTAGLPNCLP
jgi:hypothetical protein